MSADSQIITIAPGISLSVGPDADRGVVDNITERYHRGNRERELRELLVVALKEPEDDAYNVLVATLEIMGWHNNHNGRTPAQIAAAIEALIPVADVIDLVHACEQVEYEIRELRLSEETVSEVAS